MIEQVREGARTKEQYQNNVVGEIGVRDRMNPCKVFNYGPSAGRCESDGHYMCSECKELNPNRLAF